MFKKTSETTHSASTAPAAAEESGKPDPSRQGRVTEHKRSVLSPSIAVSGDISGSEDLMLDGNMDGSIDLPDNEVFIGPEGKVKANITALKVSVEGRLTGDIKSAERVVIKNSGRVEGNIVAPRVVLEDGCQFKGSVEMNIDNESSGAGSSSRTAASAARQGASDSAQAGKPADTGSKSGGETAKINSYAGQGKSRASGGS